MVNEQLVAYGSEIARRYPPDTAHADELEAAQAAPVEAEVGMWAPDACGPARPPLRSGWPRWCGTRQGPILITSNKESWSSPTRGTTPVDLTGWVVKDESASHR